MNIHDILVPCPSDCRSCETLGGPCGEGDLIDRVYFCSDRCHRAWCHHSGETYGGWNGCHEGPDWTVNCGWCDTVAWQYDGE